MKSKKTYVLYDMEGELLAVRFTLKEAKITSLEYSEGKWYSYPQDSQDTSVMYEEGKRKVTLPFGKSLLQEIQKEKDHWISDGEDLRKN